MPSRFAARLVAAVLAACAGAVQAGGPLQDLEMDVMEAGETPARAVARIALPPGVAGAAEPSLIETGRLGATEADGSGLRTGAMDTAADKPAFEVTMPGEAPAEGAGD